MSTLSVAGLEETIASAANSFTRDQGMVDLVSPKMSAHWFTPDERMMLKLS